MKKQFYEALNETVYTDVLPNGFTIQVVVKPGFSKKCAYIATNYGSIHTDFDFRGKIIHSPQGVAHYLEHKMFDLPGRDVSAEFAALGAGTNAFTSYFMTAYYFTCTEHFKECLDLLLTFVSTPYFTQESVDKERGIIGQEIRMYDDNPDSKVVENLFAAMYHHHPVRIPIAGSEETISHITPETLYQCYEAFYHPGNMILCVVGDVDPEQVRQEAFSILPNEPQSPAAADFGPEESLNCTGCDTESFMDVSMPTFQLGFKCPPLLSDRDRAKKQVIGDFAADVLGSESSSLFLRLYQAGLIDGSFACGYEDLPGAAMFSCGGDSTNPKAVRAAVMQEIKRLTTEGIDPNLFEQLKRSALGRRFRSLDSFSSLCFRLCAAHFDKVDYMDFPRLYESVTCRDVEQFMAQNLTEENSAMSLIRPRSQEENHAS